MKTWITTLILFFSVLIVTELKAQTCYVPDVQYYEWNAQKNTLPRFVVACLQQEGLTKKEENASTHRGFVIFLGQTSKGIYAIEGGQASDAVENTAGFAKLTFTPFQGARQVFLLYNNQPMEQLTEQAILKKLWKLHKDGVYQVNDLMPINFIQNPDINKQNLQLANSIQWMYKITNSKKQISILWNLQAKSSMCWCNYQWKVSKKAL
ncbi:hypothetical protein BKI52_29155 [marine bacterium AO1-C]|nr:hypothetical protein BKI52_29155 [marine bacterium AO1-C]